MTKFSIGTTIFAAAMAVVALAPKASADEWDKKTIVTITEPLEVPGATLEPGKYVFKLVNSQSDRHIVTIQNEREDHTYATILAIPNERLRPTGDTKFAFWETPAGQPKALRAWFYPGDNFGQEFRYPKSRATEITQTAHEEVPTAEAAPAPVAQPAPAVVAENTPPPAPVDNTPAPVAAAPAPSPAPAPVVVAENTVPATLPQTASNMPLFALLGLLSIGGAFGFGAFAKRNG